MNDAIRDSHVNDANCHLHVNDAIRRLLAGLMLSKRQPTEISHVLLLTNRAIPSK